MPRSSTWVVARKSLVAEIVRLVGGASTKKQSSSLDTLHMYTLQLHVYTYMYMYVFLSGKKKFFLTFLLADPTF